MSDPLFWHRLQFGFTIAYHYLFPQLTMGLALLIVVWKGLALRTGRSVYDDTARFWIKIFGLNFALGVVTGIPMEFQFGTNWASFSSYAGGVIGQTLAMEGIFAFFLESTFLALLVFGERRLGRILHFGAALALFVGSWLSGYFIVTTNAFMQHPVGYAVAPDGTLQIARLAEFLFNPWAIAQYLHNQTAALVTAAFVVAAVGAFWRLRGEHAEVAAAVARAPASSPAWWRPAWWRFPPATIRDEWSPDHQPVTLAAMEGHFESGPRAPLAMIGQPNVAERKLDNPIHLPALLSWIAYGDFSANVQGLVGLRRDRSGRTTSSCSITLSTSWWASALSSSP